MIAAHGCIRIVVTFYVALQFNARASASLTLIDDSCPAGFETVEGIILGRYSCQCSKKDLNIQRCDETTKTVLLKVRVLCTWCGVPGIHHLFCRTQLPIHLPLLNTFSWLCTSFFPTSSTLMCLPSPSPHAGLAVGHSHHQLRRYQGPVHHRLFPWLLPLPAMVHRQWGRVQVHCVTGLGPEGPAVHL